MSYKLSVNESQNIIRYFGQDFYLKVLTDIKMFSQKWKLKISHLIDNYSANCLFVCQSEIYGDAILKISRPSKEFITECNTLSEYKGRRFCNVFDFDMNNSVMLIEQIKPGIQLRDEKALDTRLAAFSKLFNGLHITPSVYSAYPTYYEWVNNITKYMSKRTDYKELYLYMKKAQEICGSLCKVYTKKMLLHGDFHHDNIVLGKDMEYRIIDPKGVIGDPIFDVPRFIINEFYGNDKMSFEQYCKQIKIITEYFEKSLCISTDIQKKCIFIETVMANCWNVEDGKEPNFDSVMFAEKIINN